MSPSWVNSHQTKLCLCARFQKHHPEGCRTVLQYGSLWKASSHHRLGWPRNPYACEAEEDGRRILDGAEMKRYHREHERGADRVKFAQVQRMFYLSNVVAPLRE